MYNMCFTRERNQQKHGAKKKKPRLSIYMVLWSRLNLVPGIFCSGFSKSVKPEGSHLPGQDRTGLCCITFPLYHRYIHVLYIFLVTTFLMTYNLQYESNSAEMVPSFLANIILLNLSLGVAGLGTCARCYSIHNYYILTYAGNHAFAATKTTEETSEEWS